MIEGYTSCSQVPKGQCTTTIVPGSDVDTYCSWDAHDKKCVAFAYEDGGKSSDDDKDSDDDDDDDDKVDPNYLTAKQALIILAILMAPFILLFIVLYLVFRED